MLVSLKHKIHSQDHFNVLLGQDIMTNEKPKEDYYREAAQYLNSGEKAAAESGEGVGGTLAFLTRGTDFCLSIPLHLLNLLGTGIHQLATRSMDDAFRSFEGVLAEKPTNLIALLGKVGVLSTYNLMLVLRLFRPESYMAGGITPKRLKFSNMFSN
jgi:RNA polymerase-associated protein CTR9